MNKVVLALVDSAYLQKIIEQIITRNLQLLRDVMVQYTS